MSSLVYTFFSRSGRAAVGEGVALGAAVALAEDGVVVAGLAGLSSPPANAGIAIDKVRITARTHGKRGTARIELRMHVPPSLSAGSMPPRRTDVNTVPEPKLHLRSRSCWHRPCRRRRGRRNGLEVISCVVEIIRKE